MLDLGFNSCPLLSCCHGVDLEDHTKTPYNIALKNGYDYEVLNRLEEI